LPKIVKLPTAKFKRLVVGTTVVSVTRRAKLVLIGLKNNQTIVIHLKMSGQLIWQPKRGRLRVGGHPIPGGLNNLPNSYSHVIFRLVGGILYFNDQRQFGFVKLQPTSRLEHWLDEQGYGPEPLSPDFTLEKFLALLKQHQRKRLKPVLMDQTVIAGIGNIYADETCFYAGVRPGRRIAKLKLHERKLLYRGMRAILALAIQKKGTTADAYRTASGDKGSMLPFLKVYGRGDAKCKRCGHTITKTVLAGRGTHYCPNCQQ
jgi:formamidopyrimidine-DNA glycosylase